MSDTIAPAEPRRPVMPVMPFFAAVVLVALLVTALGAGSFLNALTGLIWAFACLAIGTCTGFLFGIPKTLQGDKSEFKAVGPSGRSAAEERAYRSNVNTNLVEISDWLTKIIVGLGLINLKVLPNLIMQVADVLAKSMATVPSSSEFVAYSVGLIVSFTAVGFLFGYLSTRLYLATAFVRADLDGLANARETAEAASGATESLREALDLLRAQVDQFAPPSPRAEIKTDGEQAGQLISPPASNVPSGVTTAVDTSPSLAPIYEQEALKLARQYDGFSANTREERVRVRNDLAAKIALLINANPTARDWASKLALDERNSGLIAGLATAINAEPRDGDTKRLFSSARLVAYKHARYKVATAIGRLFETNLATVADAKEAVEILSYYNKDQPDESLRRRISATLAQITRATGQSLTL